MIPVKPAAEPPEFEVKVRVPGHRALAEMVGQKPNPPRPKGKAFKKVANRREDIPSKEFPTYWVSAINDLLFAYNRICAYSCFRIHRVTGASSIDHMAPKSRRWDQVYEWSNYRLASSRMNARKNDFEDILDPVTIQAGWFQLHEFGFAMCANPALPHDLIDRIDKTIERLKLNDEFHLEQREEDVNKYLDGDWTLAELVRQSPFVAMELRRHGRLREGDR